MLTDVLQWGHVNQQLLEQLERFGDGSNHIEVPSEDEIFGSVPGNSLDRAEELKVDLVFFEAWSVDWGSVLPVPTEDPFKTPLVSYSVSPLSPDEQLGGDRGVIILPGADLFVIFWLVDGLLDSPEDDIIEVGYCGFVEGLEFDV